MADLQEGRITIEDVGYDLAEIVVKPKPYIFVEVFYRVYVYRDDSPCYFLSGIMPNAYATSHNIPTLSTAARQAIGKLKQW